MHVSVSQSVELANGQWVRTDLQLDEVDLKRLLIEAGKAIEPVLTVGRAFTILEAEARRLLLATMVVRFQVALQTPENLAQIKAYQDQRDVALAAVPDA
jgi:hypothetical protein